MSVKGNGGSDGRAAVRNGKQIASSGKHQIPVDLTAMLKALAEKANRGDPQALADLRRTLDERPEIWETCGNLGRQAELAWIALLAGEQKLTSESIKKYVQRLKADLLGPHPTTVERLLVDDVAVSYLAARHSDILAADSGSQPVAVAALRIRRCESAQRRLHRAIGNLVLLRAKAPEGLAPPNSLRLFPGEKERHRRA